LGVNRGAVIGSSLSRGRLRGHGRAGHSGEGDKPAGAVGRNVAGAVPGAAAVFLQPAAGRGTAPDAEVAVLLGRTDRDIDHSAQDTAMKIRSLLG